MVANVQGTVNENQNKWTCPVTSNFSDIALCKQRFRFGSTFLSSTLNLYEGGKPTQGIKII